MCIGSMKHPRYRWGTLKTSFFVVFTFICVFLCTSVPQCRQASFPHVVFVTATDLPDDGVARGDWLDATSSYFELSSAAQPVSDGAAGTLTAPPLRVLALLDWQGQGRTEMLSGWPNGSAVSLWANRHAATTYTSRLTPSNLLYHMDWVTGLTPLDPVGAKENSGGSPSVVSAVVADLLGSGELAVVVQFDNGQFCVMNHTSTSPDSFVPPPLVPISIASTAISTRLKQPDAPQLAVVPDITSGIPDTRTAQVGLAFVNNEDQLILLSRIVETTSSTSGEATPLWPPLYSARVLVNMRSVATQRAVLPFSIMLADVNEDCAAELLFAVRDKKNYFYEIHVLDHNKVGKSGQQDATADVSSASRVLLRLSDNGEERYGESFTLADVNGDGLPELLVSVQLLNESSSCATADTAGIAELCSPYHAVRVFYPVRAPGIGGAPTCTLSAASEDNLLTYNLSQSEIFVLTPEWCGMTGWGEGLGVSRGANLPLYMPSYPSAPLLIRSGDYNRDRLADIIVPSSSGPLILTSHTDGGVHSMTCTALDAATAKAAVGQVAAAAALPAVSKESLEAYRTATPFFATLGSLGKLDVVLTHHRKYAQAAPTSASRAAEAARKAIRIYENGWLPSRSYFLSVSALTRGTHGTACIGATHHMTWQDINMRSHYASVTQLGQTQGHALLSPEVLVGLDETFSYVHGYTVGLRTALLHGRDGDAHGSGNATEVELVMQRKEWPSYLVPNAVVFAHLSPIDKPHEWRLELYLPTSTYRVLLVTALALALILIGLPVVWLRCIEIRQDFNEWRNPL